MSVRCPARRRDHGDLSDGMSRREREPWACGSATLPIRAVETSRLDHAQGVWRPWFSLFHHHVAHARPVALSPEFLPAPARPGEGRVRLHTTHAGSGAKGTRRQGSAQHPLARPSRPGLQSWTIQVPKSGLFPGRRRGGGGSWDKYASRAILSDCFPLSGRPVCLQHCQEVWGILVFVRRG